MENRLKWNNQEKEEFEELKKNLKTDVQVTRLILGFCFWLGVFFRIIFKISIPNEVFYILGSWFLIYFLNDYLIKKTKKIDQLYNLYFSYTLIDVCFLTFIVHFLGGVEWIGALFYIPTLSLVGTILPREKSLITTIFACLLYTTLSLLEYSEIVGHHVVFPLEANLYKNPYFVIVQVVLVCVFYYFITMTNGIFSEVLKKKTLALQRARKEILKAYQQAQEAREVLEIRVKARTRQLEEEKNNLEKMVKERTKDLQEKLEELEKFQKITIDRELKMVELKNEIEKLKRELSKHKANHTVN